MSWGKPSQFGKFYPGSSEATTWNQHCHWKSFSEKEEWAAGKCEQAGASGFVRPRNPLMPNRPPDAGNDGLPPVNVMRHVSLPMESTGLRAVPTYRPPPDTGRMMQQTGTILTDLNSMLSRELIQLRGTVMDSNARLKHLQMRASKHRAHSQASGRGNHRKLSRRPASSASHPLQPALMGWDPASKVSKKFGQHDETKRAKDLGSSRAHAQTVPKLNIGA